MDKGDEREVYRRGNKNVFDFISSQGNIVLKYDERFLFMYQVDKN